MRIFLIQPEHDPTRLIRRSGETRESVQATLQPGYHVVSEILDGVTVPPLPDGLPSYTYLTHLLVMYGDELRAWMKEQGFLQGEVTAHGWEIPMPKKRQK